jgi:hypothetical protein
MGCPEPLPEHWRITAQWLDGKEMTVEEAVQCLKDSAPEYERPYSIEVVDGNIMAKIGSHDDYPIHCWRVISFDSTRKSQAS